MFCLNVSGQRGRWCLWAQLGMLAISLGPANRLCAQTGSTGAVTGFTLDSSGAVLPDVIVCLSKEGGGEVRSATSDEGGRFSFLFCRRAHTKYVQKDPLSNRSHFKPYT